MRLESTVDKYALGLNKNTVSNPDFRRVTTILGTIRVIRDEDAWHVCPKEIARPLFETRGKTSTFGFV